VIAKRGIRPNARRGAWPGALVTCCFALTGVILPFFSGVPSALLTAGPDRGGTIWADLRVEGLEGAELGRNTHFVVLMSAGCRHCQEAVPEVAMLMDSLQSQPISVIALAQDSDEDLQAFTADWAPPYPIGRIDGEVFWTLLEDAELPRFFLVKAGHTIRVWDVAVPTTEEVITALGS
jgi:hypothetical protein